MSLGVLERYAEIVDDFEAFSAACDRPLPRVVRVNTIKTSIERAQSVFDATQIPWEESGIDGLLVVKTDTPGRTWPYFTGWIHGQELVSAIPVRVLNPSPQERVWDACAAPGSKTSQLAAEMDDRGIIVANDDNTGRLAALRSNTERLGVTNVIVTNQDARHFSFNEFDFDSFDRVLVDAPCSGEGTIRKNPRALDGWSEEFIDSISHVQQLILRRAVQATRAGGTVVYATCTFAPEENERVIDSVLETEACQLVEFDIPIAADPGVTRWNGEVFDPSLQYARRILPHQNDTGGFFCAKLRVGS